MNTINRLKIIALTLSACLGFLSASSAGDKVLLGIDILKRDNFEILKGKKVGLITNHTGLDSSGKSTIDILFSAPDVRLVKLFSPEHGIRGKAEHGVKIDHSRDDKTGVPVYSLYGETKRPTAQMLEGLDAMVYDIQDIGTRFYTYTTTLAYALEECAKRGIPMIVLDRPNPISGAVVEGEALDPAIQHFTAYLKIPVRHGFTAGEIAQWHNQTERLNANLTVVKMEGWSRAMWMDASGHKFRPTSPNMRTLKAAALYPGIGCFEATNVSVGRGTGSPFEQFGAPWINGEELEDRLSFIMIPGLQVKAVKFKPKSDLYKGQTCGGVKIIIDNRYEARPFDLFVQVFMLLRELYPKQFVPRWDEIALVTGSRRFQEMIGLGHSAEAMLEIIHRKAEKFQEDAAPHLLYE